MTLFASLRSNVHQFRVASMLAVLFYISFAPASAQETIGRVGAFSLPNSPWDVQWQRFRTSAEASGLHLEYFIRGELGSEESMLAALKRNRLQVGGISLQGIASVIPEINVAMTPFLFHSAEEVDFIYDHVLLDRSNELLFDHGLVLLRWLESGWFSIGAQTDIQTPGQIHGLRIGGSPNVAIQSFLNTVGADAIPIASVDLVQALETGLVDGAIKPTALIYSNLRENVESVALLQVAYDTGGLLANRQWFEGLDEKYKTALREGHGSNEAIRQEVRAMVLGQIEDMKSEGLRLINLDSEGRQLWEIKSATVHQVIIESVGPGAQVIYDDIVDGLRDYRTVPSN